MWDNTPKHHVKQEVKTGDCCKSHYQRGGFATDIVLFMGLVHAFSKLCCCCCSLCCYCCLTGREIKLTTTNAQMTHIQVQNYKNQVMSLKHTSVTHGILCYHFNEHSNHAPLNYSGQESKNNSQFMILNICDLLTRSRSSNLICIAWPRARL